MVYVYTATIDEQRKQIWRLNTLLFLYCLIWLMSALSQWSGVNSQIKSWDALTRCFPQGVALEGVWGGNKGWETTERPAPTSLLLIQNTQRVKEWKRVSWVNTVDMSVSKQLQLQGKNLTEKIWNTAVWKQRLRKRKGEGTLRIRDTFQKEPTEPSRVGNTHAKEPGKGATHIRSETFANLNKTDSSVPEKLIKPQVYYSSCYGL